MSNLLLDFDKFKQKRKSTVNIELTKQQRFTKAKELIKEYFDRLQKLSPADIYDFILADNDRQKRFHQLNLILDDACEKYVNNQSDTKTLTATLDRFERFMINLFELKDMQNPNYLGKESTL